MIEDEVIEAAQQELDSPTFAVVKDILSVHTVVRKDGRPAVAGIDMSTNQRMAVVFFAVESEPYFIWISVSEATKEIEFAGVEPGCSIYLLAASETFDPDQITAHLGMTPTDTVWKGTPRNRRNPSRAVHATHSWEFKPTFEGAGFLESKIECLANAISGFESRIASLPSSCKVEISIRSRQWAGSPQGFYFPKEIVALASSIGASIGIEHYATGPEPPPDL